MFTKASNVKDSNECEGRLEWKTLIDLTNNVVKELGVKSLG